MVNIDWSAAPQGATHALEFYLDDDGLTSDPMAWERHADDVVYVWTGTKWQHYMNIDSVAVSFRCVRPEC